FLVDGVFVSSEYFNVVEVSALMGRMLNEDDNKPGSHPAVVISESLWVEAFAGNQKMIGEVVTINNIAFTLVGIMPDSFRGVDRGFQADVWIPHVHVFREWQYAIRDYWVYRMIARVRDMKSVPLA